MIALHTLLAVLVCVFGFAAVLYVHVVCAEQFQKDMNAVARQTANIQWPISDAERVHIERKYR